MKLAKKSGEIKMRKCITLAFVFVLFSTIQLIAQDIAIDLLEWKSDRTLRKEIEKISKILNRDHSRFPIDWEIDLMVARDKFNEKCHDPEKRHIVNGVIESELGDWKAARDEFTNAIQKSPNTSIGYLFHAIASYHCKEFVRCAASATTYIEKNPESDFARLLVAECSLELGEYMTAYENIIHLCDNNPDNPYYYTRFKEVTFILIAENKSLKQIIRKQEKEIKRLRADMANLRSENEELKRKIQSLENRNRHIQYVIANPSHSKINVVEIVAAIAGVIIPYKPLQILCAIVGLTSN